MRTKRSTLFKLTLLVCLGQLDATTLTWIATAPGSDLNTASNWSPTGVPVAGDVANFDSTIPDVALNPTAVAPFTTSTLNFLQSATPFHFTFTNTTATFQGFPTVGVTGPSRNPFITITNTNNTLGSPQLFFNSANASFGSGQYLITNTSIDTSTSVIAQIECSGSYAYMDSGLTLTVENSGTTISSNAVTSALTTQTDFVSIEALDHVTLSITNSGTNGDNTINNSLGVITGGSQLASQIVFMADDYLNLALTNSGSSGVNTTGNKGGVINNYQGFVNGQMALGDFASITINNSGTNSGTSNTVGEVGICQLQTNSAFSSGNGLNLSISNTGTNTVNATNGGVAGNIVQDQMKAYSFTTGDLSTVTFLNSGVNSSAVTNGPVVATVGDQGQLNVTTGPFMSGDGLQMFVTNSGLDNGVGTGSTNVGVTTGQVVLASSFATGDNSVVTVANTGTITGTTTVGLRTVGNVSVNNQFGSLLFTAGDNLKFTAANFGSNGDAVGQNSAGVVVQQVNISGGAVGNNCTFTVSNIGVNTQGGFNTVGEVELSQLFVTGSFRAKDYFLLNVSNSGSDSSVSTTGNIVGLVSDQVVMSDFNAYDFATIVVSNAGINSGGSGGNFIGHLLGNQLLTNAFITGDNLTLNVSNAGSVTGPGTASTVGGVSGQMFYAQSTFSVGDNASITISNTGNIANGNANTVGQVSGAEFTTGSSFTTGDHFTLNVTNAGSITNSAGTSNNAAPVGNQVAIAGAVSLGDNATINVLNLGSNTGTDVSSFAGNTGEQFAMNSLFSAGENLSLIVTNTAINPNSVPNVGMAVNQIDFVGAATFKDGTLIKAVNSGTVTGTQMLFQQPFNVLGNVTFEAINTGTIANGIHVVNSAGGDINVILQNSALLVDNLAIAAPFTVGALNGDSSSTVTSINQGIIVDTDAGVNAAFAGSVNLNFFIKDGPGTQTFSGTVTQSAGSGLINNGVLNLTGSYSGNIDIRAPGILTGSGSVSNTVTNDGTLIPNKLFTVGNFFNGGSGVLVSNVSAQQGNGLLNVLGNTTLEGGTLLVGTLDGTYLFYNPYTVLHSVDPIVGTFDAIKAVSPLIQPFITYNSNSIVVTLQQDITLAAFTHNQREVAAILDGTTSPTLAQSLLISQIANLTIPQASDALDSISGEQYTNETFFNETVNRQFIRRLYDPLRFIVACKPCYDPCGANAESWLEVGGDFTFIDRAQLQGFQVTGGIHKRFSDNFLVGVAGSYEGDTISYKDHGGWQYKNNALGGAYALYRPNLFYILANGAYGYSRGHLRREIHVGDSTFKAKGLLQNWQATFYGESGVDLCVQNVMIQPFAGVEVNGYWRNRVFESGGGGWGLELDVKDRTAVYSRLGLHLTTCTPFRVSVDAAWDYRCTHLDNRVPAELLSFTGAMDIYGVKIARSSFDYALTIGNDLNDCWSAYVETTGQIYNRAQTFTVLGGVSLRW